MAHACHTKGQEPCANDRYDFDIFLGAIVNENTQTATHAAITTTQKIAAVVGGAGMGLSLADVTAWLQLIGAATGAIVGIWRVANRCRGLFNAKRGRKP